jgi:hypothetical protein
MSVAKQPALPLSPHAGLSAAGKVLLLPLRLLHSDLGRRVAMVTVLSLGLSGLISSLYDHADVPGTVTSARAAPAVRSVAASVARLPATVRAKSRPVSGGVVGGGPAAVAVGWYAARRGVPAGRVRALQQDRLGAGRVRVLVLAPDRGGRLVTALVVVARRGAGWQVVG